MWVTIKVLDTTLGYLLKLYLIYNTRMPAYYTPLLSCAQQRFWNESEIFFPAISSLIGLSHLFFISIFPKMKTGNWFSFAAGFNHLKMNEIEALCYEEIDVRCWWFDIIDRKSSIYISFFLPWSPLFQSTTVSI